MKKHARKSMANEWLDNLKAGDDVIIEGRFGDGDLNKVSRLTKTFVIVGRSKFRRNDGYAPGRCNFAQIVEPTKERRDAIRRHMWADKLQQHKWRYESLETLEKIVVILTDSKK